MTDTLFSQVNYTIGKLIDQIEIGTIGLPDIQRPFVWKNSKIRDLFDSLYQGYPVGYFLFWQNALADSKAIGTDYKQKHPQIFIVDGQQRLTSLYAVIKGISVVRENYKKETIEIAFNPLQEKFEVADAAIRRNKAYISNISMLWNSEIGFISLVKNYIENLESSREVSDEEKRKIERAIEKLKNLLSFSMTALELSSDITEDQVAEVFVRINSKGKSLNQADFILTLMSVFWDEGRTQLEEFCGEARTPSTGKPSPFNYIAQPRPDQLLRACVGLGFKRARLKYVYSILRGKDLETEQFSDERRIQQFQVLKEAQSNVLNLTYWHDYLKAIQTAGYINSHMISSTINLIFTYILYLVGRTEYGINEFTLRKVIARWFFMSSITGRYTGSPESVMEFDLGRLKGVNSAEDYINLLTRVCSEVLRADFWETTLPNELATASAISPSQFAYHASLVILEAKALFSNLKVAELLNPAITATKSAAEKHHLFPKAYLKTKGISDLRETNQTANYAYLEWGDNISISDKAPEEYLPVYQERFSKSELEQMYYWHALPQDWQSLDYAEFLRARRELIAKVIYDAYQTLTSPIEDLEIDESKVLEEIIMDGESAHTEFKSTLRINLHTGATDPRMEHGCLKTIAAFLNSKGGTLIIGVSDDGAPVGIETDNFPNEDKMSLHLVNLINSRIGAEFMAYIHLRFDEYKDSRVLMVECSASKAPVFIKEGTREYFYIRTGASSTELAPSAIQKYIEYKFKSASQTILR